MICMLPVRLKEQLGVGCGGTKQGGMCWVWGVWGVGCGGTKQGRVGCVTLSRAGWDVLGVGCGDTKQGRVGCVGCGVWWHRYVGSVGLG